MPGVARVGDQCTGHGEFPPRPADQGSPDVFFNGIAAVRAGDHWIKHCNDDHSCHDSTGASGSSTVFVNGKPLMRVGDPIACGSKVAAGSPDVSAG